MDFLQQTLGHSLKHRRRAAFQKGVTLVELAIVGAIILIIAVLGIPKINELIVENKASKVGEEMQRFFARSIANAAGGDDPMTAFATADQVGFARAVSGSSVLTVSQTNNTVAHGLGSGGTVTYGPADGGKGFSLTLTRVNSAACPSLASLMNRMSSKISINAIQQKNSETPLQYSATTAEVACEDGDANTFVFTAGNYELN